MIAQREMVYKFREGAHVPRGVTPEGILDERRRVIERKGRATARLAVEAIVEDEKSFPNLRAFGPASPAAAYRAALEDGVRAAFRSVVIVREEQRAGRDPIEHQIRVLHAVPDEAGPDLAYQTLDVIAADEKQRKWLIRELRKEAAIFARKMEDVLEEVDALL